MYWLTVSDDSVNGQLAPKQKHNVGRVLWRKAADLMATRKQRARKSQKGVKPL